MTQSLTGSWMKEITAGHAPLTTKVASIRYPCPPTSLELKILDFLENYYG